MQIYGDRISGNCLKVLYTSEKLGIPYKWIEVDTLKAETRTAQFLTMNPAGQIPVVVFDDGRTLAESNAIISYLAEGSSLLPDDAWERAKVSEWLFWEQYSHEPSIAVCRFQKVFLGVSDDGLDAELVRKGYAALDLMEAALAGNGYLAAGQLTVADIALVAYTRLAHEGGFDLGPRDSLRDWIARVEADLDIS